MSKHFQQLMRYLWQHLNLVMPPERENETYAINVDNKTNISIFVSPETHLNIISKIDLIASADKHNVLETLLALNCFTPIHPNVNFKVGVNPKTKNVELWMREPLINLPQTKLLDLFFLSVEMSEFVRNNISQARNLKQNHASLSNPQPRFSAKGSS